jgi:Pentapeptide repeats (8 copies)
MIDWHLWQIVIAAAAGFVTIIVGFRTFFWRRMQLRTWLQTEQFQSDSHTLRLCEALNEESPRLQMAAAALLFERLQQKMLKSEADRERSAIIQALLAATIGDPRLNKPTSTSPGLCKYIADSVVEILDAKANGKKQSPLREYYWQKVQLMDAYWAGVDARGVDFYGATFDRASLRRANLEGAVFYAASLVGATLAGANLRNADLRDADLRSADLRDDSRNNRDVRRTEWSGIKLAGAIYDTKTRFPPEMNPSDLGMKSADGQLATVVD